MPNTWGIATRRYSHRLRLSILVKSLCKRALTGLDCHDHRQCLLVNSAEGTSTLSNTLNCLRLCIVSNTALLYWWLLWRALVNRVRPHSQLERNWLFS